MKAVTEYSIPLEGVESEHCALIVNNRINKVKDIATHRVELNNHRAVIETSSPAAVNDTVNAIRALGYGVHTVKRKFAVALMTCASCAISVESMLNAQPGVMDAGVNFAIGTAHVEYIPGVADPHNFKAAIQRIGYDLLLDDEAEVEETLEQIQIQKLTQLKFKTYWALALSAPVMIIGMFFMDMPYANYIMWILSSPVILWLGRDFFINAWKQARHRSANMDTLVALSTGIAYLFSVFNTVFEHFWHERGLHAHVYFESSALVVAFILLGKLLEEKAKGKTSSAIKSLMGLRPKVVSVIDDDENIIQIPVEQVQVGNRILVKPGEKIAVDGIVISGSSYVDESMLSGESVPVAKTENDKVYAGTINQKGSFQFAAEKVGSDTMLAQIIKTVQDAQGSKAPVQKLVDKIAGVFVPVIILVALAAFAAWNIWGGENAFSQGLIALTTVLIIACPCALGLATPTAIMVGVGKAAEKGILIKDAESLELARKVNTVILDKTGTITEGRPFVTNEYWTNDQSAYKQILVGIEKQSEHPLADAVIAHYKQTQVIQIDSFESITGKGVSAFVNGSTYFVGNSKLIREKGIQVSASILDKAARWEQEAKTVIWFASENNVLAVIAIADKIKATSQKAIRELQQSGIEVHMLTGDNEAAARAISIQLGLSHYKAEVLPWQKADYVKELQCKGNRVAMVGDGINDSTALALADVSIAMGKGSDIAMDVAKMTIISSDLSRISDALHLSKSTVRTINQNLFWAFIYNVIGIPVAAGVLYPFNGFLLNPMLAGAAMALSSVSVVSNSLWLKYKNNKP